MKSTHSFFTKLRTAFRLIAAVSICLVISPANATAQGVADFERILLPIMSEPTPGAFGSHWVTELWAHSSAAVSVRFTLSEFGCQIPICTDQLLHPHRTVQATPWRVNPAGAPPGVLVYVDEAHSHEVSFSLRVQDISRQALTWGTEIPVVRESEFLTGTVQLLNVPTGERFRQSLRLYDVDARGDASVRIRVFPVTSGPSDPPIAETILTLAAPPSNEFHSGWHFLPGYAQIGWLTQAFPQISTEETVRLEIEPLTPGLRLWAFVAVTNNETQHVTTITPQ